LILSFFTIFQLVEETKSIPKIKYRYVNEEVTSVTIDANIIRLFISQAFATYFLLLMIPLRGPQKRNTIFIILGAFIITLVNMFIIVYIGLPFYIRSYFLTLVIPYFFLFSWFSFYKNAKLIFAILSTQVMGNVAIINGLLASYIFYGQNNPLIDSVARIITYIIFLPIVFKFVRPAYLKMAEKINKGWWILNSALIVSYMLAYFILFVPDSIFNRPNYFIHAYIGILLSLLIYSIIYFLFFEIQSKFDSEHDKQLLSMQVKTLAAESAKITTIAYKDSLTGVKNRYSLFRQMDIFIQNDQPFLVVFIDLDNLKVINDDYDHAKGDTYLKKFASAVESSVKNQGEVYRFAGDEFICLLTRDFQQFNTEQFKKNIEKDMIVDVPYYGVSLGLAYYPMDGITADDLISLADQDMYTEKKAKKIRR